MRVMPKAARSAHMQRTAPVTLPSDNTTSFRAATAWTEEEDNVLIDARASSLDWKRIQQQHFPQKTHNACRKRHERLMARRHSDDWEGPKLELLAKEYMNIRPQMWSMLANMLGEPKWQLIETIVSLPTPGLLEATANLVPVHGKGPQEPPSRS